MRKKGQIILYVILLCIVIGSMMLLKNCGKPGFPVQHQGGSPGDTIDVAIEYAPLSCYMYDDTLGGFNYDLLRLVAREGNFKMKFHPVVTLQKSLEELNDGTYDILAAQLPVTSEYREEYLFTVPVYLDRQVLVQRKDSVGALKIKNQLGLANKKVHIVKGSPMESRLRNLGREIGDTIFVENESVYGPEQLFLMVVTGEIEYAVINEKVAKDLLKDYPLVDAGTSISFTQFQSWILNKENKALNDSLNSILEKVKNTEGYKNLYNRYFK